MPPLLVPARRPQRPDPFRRAQFPLPGVRAAVRGRPRKGPVPEADRQAVERMLAERLSLRAIARITGRSRSWLRGFVNELLRERTPHTPGRLRKSPAI